MLDLTLGLLPGALVLGKNPEAVFRTGGATVELTKGLLVDETKGLLVDDTKGRLVDDTKP